MPYCPKCRSEFRAEFTVCKSCGDLPLVAELPVSLEIPPSELEGTLPVGVASSPEVTRMIEIDGRNVDLMRVCSIQHAHGFIDTLVNADIRCALVPLNDVEFPDGLQRVEVRVRAEDHVRAEEVLRGAWQSDVDREGTVDGAADASIDECPACGAHVPLDVEECPDCGLVVGMSGDDDDDEEEEEEEENEG